MNEITFGEPARRFLAGSPPQADSVLHFIFPRVRDSE